ncbi:MAG: ArnT family glycosyltransferase [Candidatus Paceibacteria bacterium]
MAFPIIAILPLTTVSIPFILHSNREVASIFQSFGLLKDGLSSYSYITYQESSASLHLYSVLSAPLIELGFIEANRLVSLLFTVITVMAIYYLGTILFDVLVARLGSFFFLTNPYFFPYSWAAKPEAVSLGLTCSALALLLKYTKSDNKRWFWLSLIVLGLGLTNHMWEAIILSPACAVLYLNNKYKQLFEYVMVITLLLIIVYFTTMLQPVPGSGAAATYNLLHTEMIESSILSICPEVFISLYHSV